MAKSTATPPGVHLRGDSIVLDFRYKGQRCRETLKGLPATKANLKFAERKRAAILIEIAQGTFDYARHFPNSPNALRHSDNLADYKTVSELVDDWLRITKPTVTGHTYNGYERAAKKIRARFQHTPLSRLTRSMILGWINNDLADYAPTTVAAYLLPLRSALRMALLDKLISHNPAFDLNLPDADYEEPDPFTLTEIQALLAVDLRRPSEHNMTQLALWTGIRTGELLALGWDDVDWRHQTLHVRRALTRDGYRVPKTRRSVRVVELLTPAIEALQAQRALSELKPARNVPVLQRNNRHLKTEAIRFIFHNTFTDEPFSDANVYRDGFWRQLLKKAKVRWRGPSNTRHTFISQMLSAGLPKEWIIRQVGHTSADIIDKHYGKWIREDALNVAAIANEKFAFGHMVVTENTDTAENQ